MLLMALLRIKRPEALKEHSPAALGRILGLDRAPEVKTLRRKLDRLAAMGRATDFGRALAERRIAQRGQTRVFLYVDGSVVVYHGKHTSPKDCAGAPFGGRGHHGLLGKRPARRSTLRCDDGSERRNGEDVVGGAGANPRSDRKTPRGGRFRPRRLQLQAVCLADRTRLRRLDL